MLNLGNPMPSPDNINEMPDRRVKSSMPKDQMAEFDKIKGMIGECTRTLGIEVGRAREGHQILVLKIEQATGNGDRRLKEHDQLFIDHDDAIKRLQQGEIDNIAEIKKLSEGLDGVINKVSQMGHVVLTTNTVVSSLQITQGDGFIAMGRQFAAVGDSINQLRSDLKPGDSATSKKWGSNIPVKAWFGIGSGVVIAIILVTAMATGNTELVDSIKGIF